MNSDDARGTLATSAATPANKASARYLNVISTKRSGHHAFISWIQAGSRQRTQFINNTAMKRGTFERIPAFCENQSEPTTVIFNYEGVTPNGVARAIAQQNQTKSPIYNLLFVRDPLNVCASLMQRQRKFSPELFKIMRQMFALSGFLEICKRDPSYADLIFYNRWLTDAPYRDRVAQRL